MAKAAIRTASEPPDDARMTADSSAGARNDVVAATAGRAEPMVRLRGVSKTYRVYANRSDRVREALDPRRRSRHRQFHALHDINLTFPRGATVGILGVNGSGKSTLLQVIAGIIPASTGTVEVNGKLAAMIELGAGLNPDLSARENVGVNGVIMGLTRAQIESRLPSIEAFADIGDFFDQPLKTYSSGMAARVGFALTIHLNPDILIIDEALAVGDARFQQKCFQRFRDLQAAGKTILYVSHDRFSLPRLCTHGVVLHAGRVVFDGDPKGAADCYNEILINGRPGGSLSGRSMAGGKGTILDSSVDATDTGSKARSEAIRAADAAEAAILAFMKIRAKGDRAPSNPTYNKNEKRIGIGGAQVIDYMLTANGKINPGQIKSGDRVAIAMRIHFEEDVEAPILGIRVRAKDGVLAYATNSMWMGIDVAPRKSGDVASYRFDLDCHLGGNDWFLDLTVARSATELMDDRSGLLHLRCDPEKPSNGLANLPIRFAQ
ncbi:MAG TPA: ABC transporter ATP-binding protein [Hyphomicrobiaceae bacterium]|nr:ABC transporter ATP-binding protein [Hyphomicrobiaceae bacterium]